MREAYPPGLTPEICSVLGRDGPSWRWFNSNRPESRSTYHLDGERINIKFDGMAVPILQEVCARGLDWNLVDRFLRLQRAIGQHTPNKDHCNASSERGALEVDHHGGGL